MAKFLALKPKVLASCPVLRSRTALLIEFVERLKIFFGKRFFLKTFFFGEHLRLCPWPREGLSLASDFFLCPWPRTLCRRLHLWEMPHRCL